jgi:hypothetical protein
MASAYNQLQPEGTTAEDTSLLGNRGCVAGSFRIGRAFVRKVERKPCTVRPGRMPRSSTPGVYKRTQPMSRFTPKADICGAK